MPVAGAVIAISAGLVALAATDIVRRNAARLGLVQAPDVRASHTRPTPTGGGIGIVAGGTIGAVPAVLASPSLALVVVSSLALAAIGLADDRRPIRASIRLLVQFALVGAMAWPALPAASPEAALLLGFVVVAAVYWVNLFNFMDGIDGIAGAQAAFMLLGGALLVASVPGAGESAALWWMVAVGVAVLGFLTLNWPPARIFMGDAGSTYLGFVIAFFALHTVTQGWLTVWQWLILGAAFVLDASLTLARRLWRREPVFEAHRLHGYQHLARRWGGHRRVTLTCLAVNVCWLLPLAWWAGAAPQLGWVAALVAAAPLIIGLIWAGAGAPETAAAGRDARTSS